PLSLPGGFPGQGARPLRLLPFAPANHRSGSGGGSMSAAWALEAPAHGEAEVAEVLLQRARRGDALALAALATRYWGVVHRVARNMLSDAAAAGDVAEAVFLAALGS